MKRWIGLIFCFLLSIVALAKQPFPDTVQRIKPSIVGIGSFSVTRQPARRLWGTGFVVSDGHHVITNWHVISQSEDDEKSMLSVFVGKGQTSDVLSARVVAMDENHDLALLRFDGPAQPVMALGDANRVREGEVYGFTGFPIGQVMGLYPVTHQGMIAAISPVMIPRAKAGALSASDLKKLRDPFLVFQLDGTAYPGNSGSPLYDIETGAVVGVINKVLLRESKEQVLSKPSGISFAVPVRHVKELLSSAGLKEHQ